ncbi:MAG: site-specific integrase [Candidatus Acididesulfobacter diazotrophicus]|uniref:Site-specific integrase n=1 Tax=Candidatus Acididesulfobacter diazotrophicus TaxID=2597226 RepID=A0A519BKA6_9DELT|nr:MAG: site-specific integrase [Candidatus Acididesulfobacter diazotrophicus]
MASIYQKNNSKVYYYSVSLNGNHYQGSCKTRDRKTAQQIANAIETDLARKKYLLPVANGYNLNFERLFKEYLSVLSNSRSTVELKTFTSKHFLPVFKDRNISGITTADIKNYQLARKLEIIELPKNAGKRESEISFRSVNMEIGTLSNFFNYCIEKGYINNNPALKIKKLNELSRLKTLSDEDIQKLISGATNKLTRDLITFLIYTGCRKGEVLNLKWDDVDLKNNIIAIKAAKTKYDRHIPVHSQLKELLTGIKKIESFKENITGTPLPTESAEAERQNCDYVFNNSGKKISDFKGSFHTACRNAGLKDMRIHDLRHVFASKMVMNGTSLYITSDELLGHRTTQMTKRYSHLVPDTLRKAVEDVFKKK